MPIVTLEYTRNLTQKLLTDNDSTMNDRLAELKRGAPQAIDVDNEALGNNE